MLQTLISKDLYYIIRPNEICLQLVSHLLVRVMQCESTPNMAMVLMIQKKSVLCSVTSFHFKFWIDIRVGSNPFFSHTWYFYLIRYMRAVRRWHLKCCSLLMHVHFYKRQTFLSTQPLYFFCFSEQSEHNENKFI